MKIQYYTKNVYGNDCNYPASEDAKLVTELTGRKTLSDKDLQILRNRGNEVEKVMQP